MPTSYLTFSSSNSFTLAVSSGYKTWKGTMEYSFDNVIWTVWDGSGALSATEGVLYLRGLGNTRIGSRFVITGSDVSCIGNIENLLDYIEVANGKHPVMENRCYDSLFYDCTALIAAPDLPAPILGALYCYDDMFRGCTNLIHPPKMYALCAGDDSFYYMFYGCTNLLEIPNLPAGGVSDCYENTFGGCENLGTLPELTSTYIQAHENMFNGCKNIKLSPNQTEECLTPYRIPSHCDGVIADNYSVRDMFKNTGGSFTGTPAENTTYYTSNKVIPFFVKYRLEDLNLSDGEHDIRIVAKTDGRTPKTSNTIRYSTSPSHLWVRAGTYIAHDTLSINQEYTQSINFSSNGSEYTSMMISTDGDEYTLYYLGSSISTSYSEGSGWYNSEYKTITFETDQLMSAEFYEWFTANFVKYVEMASVTITNTSSATHQAYVSYTGYSTQIPKGSTTTISVPTGTLISISAYQAIMSVWTEVSTTGDIQDYGLGYGVYYINGDGTIEGYAWDAD